MFTHEDWVECEKPLTDDERYMIHSAVAMLAGHTTMRMVPHGDKRWKILFEKIRDVRGIKVEAVQ